MSIQIRNVSKAFGNFAALHDVSLEVPDGDLLALLGPSGSGKTTLLRIIGGLEVADAGTVLLHGEDITDKSARDRNVGFVFQQYALFKHMTVGENIGFGLKVRKKASAEEIRDRVADLLKMVQLEGLQNRYPGQLSGGQRQRVALARALAAQPAVLLLDEPFGALDAKVRKELRQWVRTLHEELHVTSIFVTHDQEEAMELANHVVVMNKGRVEQVGSTDDLYERPATPFVFDFLGATNILPAEVRGGSVFVPDVERPIVADDPHPNGPVDVYVRPADLRLADSGVSGVDVRIESVQRTGPIVRASAVTLPGEVPLVIELPHLHHDVPAFRPGERVRLRLMQFSVYSTAERASASQTVSAPMLIGRERARSL